MKTCLICNSNFEKKKCDSIRYFDVKIFCSQKGIRKMLVVLNNF